MINYQEGKHYDCMGKCSCTNRKEDKEGMKHHQYDKCKMPTKDLFDDRCPDKVKGFNLCNKRNELRCFKQCQPISQPCGTTDAELEFFNYFTNRTNFNFSGLVVVKNTGGCSMVVEVTDRVGMGSEVATVNPGASIPIFVEGLVSLDIACNPSEEELLVSPTCDGEIIFDLEYCATKTCL
ncbi:S-Ena type endospore appendage [Halobacillus faecis]|uniref:Endospore appendages core domain-containing protein n=1 Tax=Halobacillus faecis TaxID=360184 RepID=A0A511WTH3_9BACI|nr:S-Ena type endospore appendage [Halobacillus faecis]GEN53681.1 hypothetical protein HFA01_19430 [Halobacillus faecis]